MVGKKSAHLKRMDFNFDLFFILVSFFDKYCLYTQEQLQWYQAIYDDVSPSIFSFFSERNITRTQRESITV